MNTGMAWLIAHLFFYLQVTNLMLYPDFEANFDLFEALRSMQVGKSVLCQ